MIVLYVKQSRIKLVCTNDNHLGSFFRAFTPSPGGHLL